MKKSPRRTGSFSFFHSAYITGLPWAFNRGQCVACLLLVFLCCRHITRQTVVHAAASSQFLFQNLNKKKW